jgi:transcriptional regulator with GAF, ATPase, and Fis domain
MSELELAQMFADMAVSIETQRSAAEALEESVRLAVAAIDGAEMAGISWLVRGQKIETPFCTDPLVSQLDSLQSEFGEGPAIDATIEGTTSVVDDTSTDERWPKFSRAVADLEISSLLSCQLSSPRRALGSLNLYAYKRNAFDPLCKELAEIYAAHASIVLASRSLENDLRTAVDTRGIIGQAMGILIERHKVTPGQAFDMLVKASQNRHMKLRDVAGYVVQTGIDPAAL